MSTIDQSSPEFDAAFAEAAAALRGEAPSATSFKPVDPDEGVADAQPVVEQPAAAEPAATADQPEQAPVEDELARLRRELEEAKHRERSASARVSAFHRKLNQTNSELEALRSQRPAAAPAAAPAPAEDPDLKAALEEMPEVAKLVHSLVQRELGERVGAVERRVDEAVRPLREDAEMRAAKAELSVVEQEFPDWNELVFSDPFQAWKDQLPPAMRSAWDHASTGQDALAFLRMYRQQTEGAAAPTPTPSPSPAPQVQAQAKRDKLSQAVGVPSRPAVAQTGMPAADDFDANFAFFAAQQRRGS